MRRIALSALLLSLLLVPPAFLRAQSSSAGNQTFGSNTFPGSARSIPVPNVQDLPPTMGPPDMRMAGKRLEMLNAERQKQLVEDANKLLALARELNGEIAQSNTGELTPEQLRKVAEIEKLAHSVRDKMSLSVRSQSPGLDMGPVFLNYP